MICFTFRSTEDFQRNAEWACFRCDNLQLSPFSPDSVLWTLFLSCELFCLVCANLESRCNTRNRIDKLKIGFPTAKVKVTVRAHIQKSVSTIFSELPDPFVSKHSLAVHHHRFMKRLDCYVQGQCHRRAWTFDWVFVRMTYYELLNFSNKSLHSDASSWTGKLRPWTKTVQSGLFAKHYGL